MKNLIFNFLLIYLTSFIIRKKLSNVKAITAAVIGSVYAILALYYSTIFNSILLKIIISIVMLTISFGKKEITIMTTSFFSLSYLIAGIISSILKIDGQLIMFLFAISMIIIFYLYERNKKYNEYYEINMQIYENEINLLAKLDTGNELRDSLFGDAVIVVSEDIIKDKVDDELIKILNNEKLEIPERYKNRIKLISFKTISGDGIKIGVKLDKLIIYTEKKQIESKAIMILSEKSFKNYDALIGNNLLQGGYEYENISFNKIKNERTL